MRISLCVVCVPEDASSASSLWRALLHVRYLPFLLLPRATTLSHHDVRGTTGYPRPPFDNRNSPVARFVSKTPAARRPADVTAAPTPWPPWRPATPRGAPRRLLLQLPPPPLAARTLENPAWPARTSPRRGITRGRRGISPGAPVRYGPPPLPRMAASTRATSAARRAARAGPGGPRDSPHPPPTNCKPALMNPPSKPEMRRRISVAFRASPGTRLGWLSFCEKCSSSQKHRSMDSVSTSPPCTPIAGTSPPRLSARYHDGLFDRSMWRRWCGIAFSARQRATRWA